MTVYERALASRTVRRYSQNKIPTHSELVSFIECARVSPSAANRQRVRFALIEGERADAAYAGISLGGYLPEDKRPSYENRPTAYIVLMSECDEDTNLAIDIGIYAQTIALAASEAGYGTCMIRSFRREHIIPLTEAEGLKAHLVIAIGEPAECARIKEVGIDGDIKYYYDESGVNVVPKRSLSELIV